MNPGTAGKARGGRQGRLPWVSASCRTKRRRACEHEGPSEMCGRCSRPPPAAASLAHRCPGRQGIPDFTLSESLQEPHRPLWAAGGQGSSSLESQLHSF